MTDSKKSRKWITKVRMYRFQCYLDETIEFDRGTNAIVGRSDSGKSTISRALYWVLYNRPLKSGKRDDLTTWGQNQCFVTVTFSDGTEITRGRQKGENFYILTTPDGVTRNFKGFGVEVPKEITDAHGMYRMDVDDTTSYSLNMSLQLDPIFLFEESGPKRAKTIGKISGADKVDGALGIVNSWRNEYTAQKKALSKSIRALTEKLKSFSIIDSLETAITTLEELVGLISEKESVYDDMSNLLSTLKNLQIQKDQISIILQYENNVIDLNTFEAKLNELSVLRESIQHSYQEYLNAKQAQERLTTLLKMSNNVHESSALAVQMNEKHAELLNINAHLSQINHVESQIAAAAFILSQADNIRQVEDIISILSDKVVLLERIQNEYSKYLTIHSRVNKGNDVVGALHEKLSRTWNNYIECLKVVKECPFCSSEITEDRIANLQL